MEMEAAAAETTTREALLEVLEALMEATVVLWLAVLVLAAIVLGALLRVGEDIVRLRELLEGLLGLGAILFVRLLVRVMDQSQSAGAQ